ncbi:Copine [Nesidiocoris tenuis]|uniref:Copine n=2 Tax=Nesidiocoris tenuis TaxID=355587 RepID=A0ABN7B1Q1_9HEMI|nr:Copine [Nesidiocoris tenuis]
MPFTPGTADTSASHVELSICCRDLSCKDMLSKSDPMVVTFLKPFGQDKWVEYHRTEVVTNSHDPDFLSKPHLEYHFEEHQQLKFEVYDLDSSSTNLADHDFLGFATCSLGQIITGGKVVNRLEMRLLPRIKGVGEQMLGHIIVSAEEMSTSKDELLLKVSGQNLDKKDWFGKSDPFLEYFKSTEGGEFSLVHRTEVIKVTLNPSWKEFPISVRAFCNGDYDRSIKVLCYDWNRSGNHDMIGEFYTTLRDMLDPSTSNAYTLIHPDKLAKKKSSYKGSGTIVFEKVQIKPVYSFLDYIKGGTQIYCTVAIDFTGSNGDPRSPESLHFISAGMLNSYEQAIMSVVSIIEDYDSDKQFPVLGFGARIPPEGHVSHEFFVNMQSNPHCFGVSGVLEAYRNCIRQIQLSGPTNFAPVINHVANIARNLADGSSYFILLILTDGVITDMPQTCQAIVKASSLPISIIIVGIGNADFTAMEQLDGDTVALSSGGKRADRDIVQFVPFSKFLNAYPGQNVQHLLAKEVLAEIPFQFTSFMKSKGIAPKPPQIDSTKLPPDIDATYS